MNRFLRDLGLFTLPVVILTLVAVLLPATPEARTTFFYAKIAKDARLQQAESPRIILVGDSSVAFGFTSGLLKEALGLNPVNTALTGGVGLVYAMDQTWPRVRPGDVVVVAPGYDTYFGNIAYGNRELLKTVLDVAPGDVVRFRPRQWMNTLPFLPRYVYSKFYPGEYIHVQEPPIYGAHAFNEYGDVISHFGQPQREVLPYPPPTAPFNPSFVDELVRFRDKVEARGAMLFYAFPGIQLRTFVNREEGVTRILELLTANHFRVLGTPEEYVMPDNLLFDSPYHLSSEGMDRRSDLLIGDLLHHPDYVAFRARQAAKE